MILIQDSGHVQIEVGMSTDQDQEEVVFSIVPVTLPATN